MKRACFSIGACIILMMVLYACSKSSTSPEPDPDVFDKEAMLINYADNQIIPGYTALQQKIADLQTASETFLAAPSEGTLNTVTTAYRATYLQYQKVAVFQFGPAETNLLDLFLNFSGGLDYSFNTSGELTGFSIDSVSIENNITTGTYNLTSLSRSSFYSQGFPALEYLFFGPDAIAKFNTNTAARKKYVRDVIARMKLLADNVASGWTSYRSQFISNTKTDVGSPIAFLVNQFAYQMDLLKGPRLGWPLGKQSNNIAFPSKTEGYFSGISVQLAIGNLTNLRNAYNGSSSGLLEGKGISDYLISLKKEALDTELDTQFDLALQKLNLIPDPLSGTITSSPETVNNAYREVQKLLTLLKTDLASATGVQITFMDNDGD